MAGYPYAETTLVADLGCKCSLPDFTRKTPTPEKVAGYKAKLGKRIDRAIIKWRAGVVADYAANGFPRPGWIADDIWADIEKERAR